MDSPHSSHRSLPLPNWAHNLELPDEVDGLDLRDPTRLAEPQPELVDVVERVSSSDTSGPAVNDVRRTLCDAFDVPLEMTYLGPGIAHLFRTVCQRLLKEGDRVAIAEPTPDWVKNSILEVGAAYIDIGRDWTMEPLQTNLERLLEDGDIKMVFSQSVCSLTGTTGLQGLSDRQGLLWVQDHSYNPSPKIEGRGLHLIDLSQREGALGLPLCVAVGSANHIDALWRLDPSPAVSSRAAAMGQYSLSQPDGFVERSQRWTQWRSSLNSKLRDLGGIRITGSQGPALMLGHPRLTGEELQVRLANLDLHATHASSHTHHDHVILRLPRPEELERLIKVLTKLWS